MKETLEKMQKNDINKVQNFSPFIADITVAKLKKRNIQLSPSVSYRRPDYRQTAIATNLSRAIQRNEV